jgi:3',5'-cyclic AMP phosphodiesterase CpdA
VLHLSDVHVQVDYLRLPLRRFGWRRAVAQLEFTLLNRSSYYRDAQATLRRIAAEASAVGADHVVLTGDLTGLALEEEFAQAREALGPLAEDPSRFSLIPGNHDRYTAHAVRQRRFERHFGHLLKSDLPHLALEDGYPYVRLVGDSLAVVGLDSTRLPPVPGLSFGALGKRQLAALAKILQAPELARRAVLALVHHAPLHRSGRKDNLVHGLWDAGALLELLTGRAASIHHGHIHHRYWLEANSSRPHIFNAGTATCRGEEGYWLIDFDGPRLVRAEAVSAAMTAEPPYPRPVPEGRA